MMARATEELNYRDEKENKRGVQDGERKKEKNDLTSQPIAGSCIHSSVLQATGLRTRRPHLPQINQRRLVLPVVNLQSDAVCAIDNGLHNPTSDPACRQAHGNAVADLELALWLVARHGEECTLVKGREANGTVLKDCSGSIPKQITIHVVTAPKMTILSASTGAYQSRTDL